ncbi:MAG: DUF721 domain-containing protein [Candidatus Omnitrophota bacterium]
MHIQQQPESIQNIIKRINLGQHNTTKKILDKWKNLVGNSCAKHSEPVQLRNGILIINVDSSAWMYMLRLKKAQVLDKLKKIDNELRDIRLRIGKIADERR